MDELPDDSRGEEAEAADTAETAEVVAPKPQKLRKPALALFVVCATLVLGLFAQNRQYRFSVPLGLALLLAGSLALLHALRAFDVKDEAPQRELSLSAALRPLGLLLLAGLGFAVSLAVAQYGALPGFAAGGVVFACYLALLAGVHHTGRTFGVFGAEPLFRHYGFWLMALAGALYLPSLGVHSLTDPWETHYGEVAREILARDDWISLWWVQEDWFWSKPILNFWIQALAMSALFTNYLPGQMLIGAGGMPVAHPEWVVRAPNVLLTLLGMYVIYRAMAKVFGKRAGFLGGFVLASCPHWYFIAHQTMADMPFVAPMTAAMGFLLLGLHTPEDELVPSYHVRAFGRRFEVTAWHLLFLAILLCALPQILYLGSRNLEINLFGEGPRGISAHLDRFQFGSGAGICGEPGNKACRTVAPAIASTALDGSAAQFLSRFVRRDIVRFVFGFEPALQALLWTCLGGAVLVWNLSERRRHRIYFLAAWLFAAIGTMGKGPVGLALPALCTLLYLLASKRFGELLKLEIVSGLMIVLAVALPWYVAMYVRHGSPFTDRLIFHDMWKRALDHVHDTNEGDDTSFRFYVWQLGYALFPWSGLAPLGLLGWMKSSTGSQKRADGATFLFMWFLFAFALFSLMGTKFHHYIFPAVPPLAMLTGVLLDELLGHDTAYDPKSTRASAALAVVGAICAATALVFAFGGSWFGWSPAPGPRWVLALGTGLVATALLLSAALRVPRTTVTAPGRSLLLGGGALSAAFAVALVGRDLFLPVNQGGHQPGPIRFLQLFTYQYRRPWPDSIDFTHALAALTATAALLCFLLAFVPIRRMATFALLGLAGFAAFWGENVYFVKTSQHWGQHELIEAYYRDRADPSQRLVAYQMNWKGENFYTGNQAAVFVSTGATFKEWLAEQRKQGAKVMYFVTEHTRTTALRSEVRGKSYTEITDKVLCNKFVVVRAEL